MTPATSLEADRTIPQNRRRARYADLVACLLLTVAAAVLFLTSPRSGDFSWSDAPRHALDGVFYHDLVRDAPFRDIKQYAFNYYLQYPALTIVFYPPLFPVVEAAFYGIFGVSHSTAQLAVTFFYLMGLFGIYALCRRWMDAIGSFAVALLFAGLPEIALWGRQVMLEIPALAFVLWAAYVLFRYLDSENPRLLWVLMGLITAGIYTKQTVAWFLLPCLWMLVSKKGISILRNRHLLWSGAVMVLSLVPWAYVSWRFGRVNLTSVVGGDWTPLPVFSIQGLLFYLKQIPAQVGWITALVALGYVLSAVIEWKQWTSVERFMLVWFGCGYVFFSLLALKEPRHTTLILFPIAFLAVAGLRKVLPALAATAVVLLLAIGTFAHTVIAQPVPRISGYPDVVDYVAQHAPQHSVILFSGYRDGNVVFALRALARRDLYLLRSDKLLLRVSQRRELGVKDLDFSEAQVVELLDTYGVSYIVNQPNFWDDLPSMRALQAVLKKGHFRKVASFPITSNVNHEDTEIEIYENPSPVRSADGKISIDLPFIQLTVDGNIGASSHERSKPDKHPEVSK